MEELSGGDYTHRSSPNGPGGVRRVVYRQACFAEAGGLFAALDGMRLGVKIVPDSLSARTSAGW